MAASACHPSEFASRHGDREGYSRNMEGMSSCSCCRIVHDLAQRGAVHPMGSHWTVNARIDHVRPGLVLQSRSHREGLADLDVSEREDLGRVLGIASRHLESLPNVEKVYVSLWNEGSPGHVHFHLIPRCTSDRGNPLGPALPDLVPSDLEVDMEREAERVSRLATVERVERSKTVLAILSLCHLWSRISLYRLFSRKARLDGEFDNAERYVMTWMSLWISSFLILASNEDFRGLGWVTVAPILAICIYRMVDVALFEVRIILRPTDFKSIPRGLLLRVLNLVEVMFFIGVLLQVRTGLPPAHSLLEGFRAATVQTGFSQPGKFADCMLAVASATSLTLLAGGVAMLLSKVADQVREMRID
jgi:diadenosine tetraphosphate (Ap4A) HIT family hydrolase